MQSKPNLSIPMTLLGPMWAITVILILLLPGHYLRILAGTSNTKIQLFNL